MFTCKFSSSSHLALNYQKNLICIWFSSGYRRGTGKMRPFFEMLRPLYSSMFLMAVTTFWISLSPSDILELQPRMFFYMVGTVFSHICCRLIVAQMSSTRCEAFNWTLFPVTALALVSVLLRPGMSFETAAVYILAILSTLAQIHYGVCIVSDSSALYC